MRISRLQLRDVKRYRDLQIDLAPGLTIIRGPNESGKSTIARAIELGLTGSLVPTGTGDERLDGLRSWDAEPSARPTVTLDFSVDGDVRRDCRADGLDREGVRSGRVCDAHPRRRDGDRPGRGGRHSGRADRGPDRRVLPLDGAGRPRRARGPRPGRGHPARASQRLDQRRGPEHRLARSRRCGRASPS